MRLLSLTAVFYIFTVPLSTVGFGADFSEVEQAVVEGIRHFDEQIFSCETAVTRRNIYYQLPWSDAPLTTPIERLYEGQFWMADPKDSYIVRYSRPLVTGEVDEDTEIGIERRMTYDGSRMFDVVTHQIPSRPTKREYHIRTDVGQSPLRSYDANPKRWFGLDGMPFGDLLINPHVIAVEFERVEINGEDCCWVRIRMKSRTASAEECLEPGEESVHALVNLERGYRPQRVIEASDEKYTETDIELKSDANDVWHPAKVVRRRYISVAGKKTLLAERQIEFKDFRANVEVPEDRFIVEIPENATVYRY